MYLFYIQTSHLEIEVPVSKWVRGSVTARLLTKIVPIGCFAFAILKLGLSLKALIVIRINTLQRTIYAATSPSCVAQ